MVTKMDSRSILAHRMYCSLLGNIRVLTPHWHDIMSETVMRKCGVDITMHDAMSYAKEFGIMFNEEVSCHDAYKVS